MGVQLSLAMLRTLVSKAPRPSVARRQFSSEMGHAVIVSAVRTPIGSFGGSLSSVSAPNLGAAAISAAVDRAGIASVDVQEVVMGHVIGAGVGQAPARQATLFAGLPNTTICSSVNKVCASGMKSVMLAAQSIMLGQKDCMVAGGMESMSNVPYYSTMLRNGQRLGHGQMFDGIVKDGLWDVYNDKHMGSCAEDCSRKYGIGREAQDEFAIESYRRAEEAIKNGAFEAELVPFTVESRRGETVVDVDEEWNKIKLEKVPTLKPAFEKNGTVTAANSSKLSDGASALVIMSEAAAEAQGLEPLARIIGFGEAAQAPVEFTTAPAVAIPKALKSAGLTVADVGAWEINEAFSVVSLVNQQLLDLDSSILNMHGGAVALGHPIGCSGARIITTLAHIMQQKDIAIGCAAICNGGGGASAIVLEKM